MKKRKLWKMVEKLREEVYDQLTTIGDLSVINDRLRRDIESLLNGGPCIQCHIKQVEELKKELCVAEARYRDLDDFIQGALV